MGRRGLAEAPSAYQRALTRLARRDHSESELRRALLERGHEGEEVEAALRRLRSEGYLDDRGFAERYARSRLAGRGLGRLRVQQGLRERGVDRGTAEAGLRAAVRDVPEAGVLEAVARRYWRQRTRDEPALRLRKLWAFLLRRGFPASLVNERLRALWPRWQDAIEGLEPVEETEA
jgi:regulatory protein